MKNALTISLGVLLIASLIVNGTLWQKYNNKNTTVSYSRSKNSVFDPNSCSFSTSKCQVYYDPTYDFGLEYPIDEQANMDLIVRSPSFDATLREVQIGKVLNIQVFAKSSLNEFEQNFLDSLATTPVDQKSIVGTSTKLGQNTAYYFDIKEPATIKPPTVIPQLVIFGKNNTYYFTYDSADRTTAQQIIATLQTN